MLTLKDVVPAAQQLLQAGGVCSCFYRLYDGQGVLCAEPADRSHLHGTTWVEARSAGR